MPGYDAETLDIDDRALVERLLGFARLLRHNGLGVGARESLDGLEVAREVGVLEPRRLRVGLRSLFCSCHSDWRRFDELFEAYWFGRRKQKLVRSHGAAPRRWLEGTASHHALSAEQLAEAEAGSGEEGGGFGGASAAESLARADFREVTDPDQVRLLHDLAERLAARMRRRLTRRLRSHRHGRRVDLRNTIHKSLRYGGAPMDLVYRRRRRKPFRLVIFLDVSGSMSLYSTFFLHFVRGVLETFREAEAFVFHTRLIHIGEALKERDLEKALYQLALISSGWGGGTRIGESLQSFNRHYAARVLNARSAVMVVSDGFDTGPPELLAHQLRVLRRRAKRIIWLNPLLGREGYEPLAGGMAAALPFIDLFLPAHSLESLAALEPHLARL